VAARYRIDWTTPGGALSVIEPRLDEVVPHVRALVAGYNDAHNADLLGHVAPLVETDVLDHYEALLDAGAHPFLLFHDGALAGDADLRGVAGDRAEFAFLIAAPAAQGKGLGTRFAQMIHALAFTELGLERIYAAVIPKNVASRRVFEKLGYQVDASEAARAFGDPGDVVLAIDRATFADAHGAVLSELRIGER